MIVNKITVGFVIQKFDSCENVFISQEFIAGDEVSWEDDEGNILDTPCNNSYLCFNMEQPGENEKHKKQLRSLANIACVNCICFLMVLLFLLMK